MANFILTGAGFTRNWGAWLASEAFEYLLSCPKLDDSVRRELWSDWNKGGGFETTLERLHCKAAKDSSSAKDQVKALEEALVDMFQQMDKGLRETRLEFNNVEPVQVSVLLQKFDAIFTLNQDLLLERHYFGDGRAGGSPGVPEPHSLSQSEMANPVTVPQSVDIQNIGSSQPYFKLHGSQNWRTSDGKRLLIMGGNKAGAIGANPFLRQSQEMFSQKLKERGTRLMIIGYGFRDTHINTAICEGCAAGLDVFIVDPLGVGVLDQRVNPKTDEPTDLMKAVQPKCIGSSRRPISMTCNRDWVEHAKLMRFLDGN